MMTLSLAAQAVKGRLVGADTLFSTVTTDSRKVAAGDLFVALKGERFDGHDFLAQCFEQGAVAAMVDERPAISNQLSAKPLLLVSDTRLALGDLAAAWRARFVLPLTAVTGSNGKTTVKEMLAAILLETVGVEAVLATEGNLNNDIGLPLTLLKLRPQHRYAVAEMGMNHPGEIAYLTRIAKPTVALINNAQPAHLAGMGSVEAVAQAKGEIFEGLAADGTAVINADDAFAPFWKQLAAPRNVMTFGLEHPADVSASYQLQAASSQLWLKTPQGETQVLLAIPGLHNVRNALAATAAALAMGVALPAIVQGLQQFNGVKGRLQRKAGKNGTAIIDDSYNANPASVRAAIEVLAAAAGKKILVLGDMGELGEGAGKLHEAIGIQAKQAGIEMLLTLGELSRSSAEAFGSGAQHFASPEELAAALQHELTPRTTVLVKGSRFMRMERVVALLTDEPGEGH